MACRKPPNPAEPKRIAALEAERMEAARKALDADIAAALDLVIATTPLSDEARQRIAELMGGGCDLHRSPCNPCAPVNRTGEPRKTSVGTHHRR
jgi:hypothetical protein